MTKHRRAARNRRFQYYTTPTPTAMASLDSDGWYYSTSNIGTPAIPIRGDWRSHIQQHTTIPTLTETVTQRYNASWETVEIVGGSVESDSFTITDGHHGFGYRYDPTSIDILPLINVSPSEDGAHVGSVDGISRIIGSTAAELLKFDEAVTTELRQPIGDTTLELEWDEEKGYYYAEFLIIESATAIEEGVAIWIPSGTNINGARIYAGNHLPSGTTAIGNVGLTEFLSGMGHTATIGKNLIDWETEYPVLKDIEHIGFISSNKPLVFEAGIFNDVTIPKFELRYHAVEEQPMLALPPWSDTRDYAAGDWIWEGYISYPGTPKIYKCLVDGVQTGTFASNADKWMMLGAEVDAELDRVMTTVDGHVVVDDNGNLMTTGG